MYIHIKSLFNHHHAFVLYRRRHKRAPIHAAPTMLVTTTDVLRVVSMAAYSRNATKSATGDRISPASILGTPCEGGTCELSVSTAAMLLRLAVCVTTTDVATRVPSIN